MSAVFQYPYTVTQQDIDELGHANNLAYLRWLLDAACAHTAALGWPAERYRQQGAAWVVRAHSIKYLLPALHGDQLLVLTWIADLKRFSSTRRYEVVRPADGALLSVAFTDWAFVDLHTGTLKRVPDEISKALPVLPAESVHAKNG